GWAFLLDRLDPAWVSRFDTTGVASLAAFADSTLAPRPASPHEFAPADLAAAGEAATRAAAGIAARMTAARDSFYSRPGWRAVFVTEANDPFYVNKMDPMNMTQLAGTEVLHQRWLKVSNLSLTLEARDVPALTEGVEGQPLMSGVRQVVV